MSIAVDTATPMLSIEQRKRARNVGFSLIFLALISAFFLSGRPGDAGFKLVESFTLVLPAQPFAQALAVVLGALGAVQLYRGFGKWTNVVLAFATAMFVVGFLAWATSGGSFNLTGMLQDTVTRSVPITLGAIAGILCERSGIINIAIEGQLLGGAFAGAVIGFAVWALGWCAGCDGDGRGAVGIARGVCNSFQSRPSDCWFCNQLLLIGAHEFLVSTCAHSVSRVQHR
jgi:simple sugar transport system permease protein